MAKSYGDMQQRIIDELKRPDLGPQVKNAIQDAIMRHKDHAFYAAETSSDIQCEVGTREYDLPTDFGSPILARINYDNTASILDRVTIEELDIRDSEGVQSEANIGIPSVIAYFGETGFHLDPRPQSADYFVTFRYHSNIAAPVDDSDQGFWMNEGERLIRTTAKSIMWSDVLRQYDKAQAEEQLALLEYGRLMMKTERRHYDRGVVPYL